MIFSRLVGCVFGFFSVSLFAELPSQKILTLEVAQLIAQETLAQCRAEGFKVSVSVVDHANVLKVFLRDDGATAATVESARMKGNSVMIYERPSGPPPNSPLGAPVTPPLIAGTSNSQGGVPIKVADKLIGAVSVSGAPGGDKDAACANFALQRVADKLK
jgi:uncharacterized protein GlcG (DUF336 family)